jgi:hypothetical protein
VSIYFGDGKSKFGVVFEGDKGFTDTHAFADPGKYVLIYLAQNGQHKEPPGGSCPGVTEEFVVFYQTPQEITEEEAQMKVEQAEREAKERAEAEEKAAAEAKRTKEIADREAREKAAREKFGGSGKSGSGGSQGSGDQGGPAFWQTCRAHVLVHGVGCPKARKVLGRARRKNLVDDSPQEVLGFSCHLTNSRPHKIACRRGKSRILAPL